MENKKISQIMHLTSNKNFALIQKAGVLYGKTNPDNYRLGFNENLRKIITFDNYLVGIPEDSENNWKESGLQERLSTYTSNEIGLLVPILSNKGFVRNHYLYSPSRIKKDFGIDLLDEEYQDSLFDSSLNSTKEGKRVGKITNKCKSEYYDSSISLFDYSGNYAVPEIWLHQETPVNLIRKVGGLD